MRRRSVQVLVETAAPRPPRVHLHAHGSDRAAGTIAAPLGTWNEVLERLRGLYAIGVKEALVRVLGEDYPRLDADSRRAISELERLGMRLHFEMPESLVRGAALMKER